MDNAEKFKKYFSFTLGCQTKNYKRSESCKIDVLMAFHAALVKIAMPHIIKKMQQKSLLKVQFSIVIKPYCMPHCSLCDVEVY